MPRILHTADLHINALRKFRRFYLDRMAHTLTEISKVAAAHKVDFIVVAGDIFDRLDIHHRERKLLSEWLRTAPAQIIGISGNHDHRGAMGDTSLSYLQGLTVSPKNHFIYDGPPFILPWPTCTFLLLPYEKWTDSEFYVLLDALVPEAQKMAFDKKNPLVVVMHEAVTGAVADNGTEVKYNRQVHLDKKLLKKHKAVTYWALGDMHTCQSIAPNVWYSGAPHQTNFGENDGKGVLIVDTDNPTEPQFVELPSRPLVTVEESPEDYELDPDALYRFRPGHAVPLTVHVPENAVLEATTFQENLPRTAGMSIGVFEGLDNALLRAGLKKDLVPLGVKLARKAAKALSIKTAPAKRK